MIYTLFFAYLIGFGLYLWRYRSHTFLICTCLFLLIIMGFRDISVGYDTRTYVNDFYSISRINIESFPKFFANSREPMYSLISWLSTCISNSYNTYLIIWALFPVIAFYSNMKRELEESRDYMIFILVFCLLGLFAFFVAGIRQTAALSILFFSYRYFKSLDFLYPIRLLKCSDFYFFIGCVLCAYHIHNSSILIIMLIPLQYIRVKKWHLFIAIGAFFLGSYARMELFSQLASNLFGNRFAQYGTTYESSLSLSGYFLQMILYLICFFKRTELIERNPDNNLLFNAMLLGIVFQSLTGILGEMYRVSFFFSIFDMILVPRALKCYDNNRIDSILLYIPFIIFSLIYLFLLSSTIMPNYKMSIDI